MQKQNLKNVSLPRWANGALQSTAYFIGYELSKFKEYHLVEGDLVKQFVEQIQIRINNLGLTKRETMYKELDSSLKFMKKKRADIVLYKRESEELSCIIEVKRAEANPREIEKDLERLAYAKKALPNSRCFLVIFSQRQRPNAFVSKKGNALKKPKVVGDYFASTIRVCKTTNSFKGADRANYACLIEVSKRILTRDDIE